MGCYSFCFSWKSLPHSAWSSQFSQGALPLALHTSISKANRNKIGRFWFDSNLLWNSNHPNYFKTLKKLALLDERIGSVLGSSIFSQIFWEPWFYTRNQFFNFVSTTVMNFKDRPDNHQGSVPVSDDSPLLVLSPCHAQRPCQPRNNPLVFSPTNYLLGISSKETMTIGAPTEQWNSNLVERSMKLTSIAVPGCFFSPIQFSLFKSPPPLCGCNSRFRSPQVWMDSPAQKFCIWTALT